MSLWKKYKNVSLITKMMVSLTVGVLLGIVFGEKIVVIKPLGNLFLNFLKMICIPLIILNVIGGIASLDDPKTFGRAGGGIMLYYCLTTVFAIVIGLAVALLLKPGLGFILSEPYEATLTEIPSLGQTLVNLLPTNIFSALVEGKLDQIVVFCAFMGIAGIFLPKEKKEIFTGVIDAFAAVLNKLIAAIMYYAPIGVCALIASAVGVNGKALFGSMANYLACSYISVAIQLVLYCVLLFTFTRVTPQKFFKTAAPLISTGLGTCSSLACIPVSMDCADKLGVPKKISGFTIPLGAQFNKDGNGIMLAITFIFAAQCIGQPISLGILLRAVFIALILTTGAGGVPGGSIVALAIICETFGLPVEVVGVIAGIFTLIDMPYTTMNVLGDLVGTTIVGFRGNRRKART